jgi:hypothetical protein
MTTRDKRIAENRKTLKEIGKIWDKIPELRFGQLLYNCMRESEVYYISNDKLLKRLQTIYTLLAKKPLKKK